MSTKRQQGDVVPPCDAVLMIAFGGPTKSEEIRPFLANVLQGVPVRPERLEEAARHYEALGGRSPITELTFGQAKSLAALLEREGSRLPVYVGMRYWHPFVTETVEQMVRDGRRRAVALIMAAHDSGAAGWNRSVAAVTTALDIAGPSAPKVDFAQPCYDHPDFITAMAERVYTQLQAIPHTHRHGTPLVFTAHSIPASIAASSPYVQQLETSCRLVAEVLGHPCWFLAYQSRSGDPREPWLEPDVANVLRTLHTEGHRSVVVAPIGFVCDHVEVRYDLDVEAKALADTLGIDFKRAGTVNDHPLYIRTLADLVRRRMAQG
ncbi:MAG: ferrochelatase [Candidatus Methylomirabilis oxygeniifera]|uniref:Ferrochelatase n=1 Tax=Methylomirabilis oxygeniifera TaxID=671143 RepID=D5MMI5_METO1|nr:MAG: ferrochelatase [Candidatus Methylomirabilis oxyfera]CBE70107.1 Ferrochelatase [Candidatus Methylomirabilis oxyfera]